MDDVLFNFSKAFYKARSSNPEQPYPQSQVDFFRKLEPLDGAIDGFRFLCANFEAYILTAPSIYNPLCYMEKRLCVEDHFGFEAVDKLIISPRKDIFIGDYLIDDRIDTHRQGEFTGKLIRFGLHPFNDWSDIVAYFKHQHKL